LSRIYAAHRKLFLQLGRWHLLFMNSLNEKAIVRFAWDYSGPGFPAFQHTGDRAQVKTCLLCPAAVAYKAFCPEDREDLAFGYTASDHLLALRQCPGFNPTPNRGDFFRR